MERKEERKEQKGERKKKEKQWSKWERAQMLKWDPLRPWALIPKPPSDDEASSSYSESETE